MKTKLYMVGIILILITMISVLTNQLMKQIKEKQRISLNFENSKFEMDSTYNADMDAYQYKVEGLEMKNSELEKFNGDLLSDVEKMGIKNKNLNGIIVAKTRVIANLKKKLDDANNTDDPGIVTSQINDTLFQASFKDNDIELLELISVRDNGKDVEVEEIHLEVGVDLNFVEEINWKGWWFWRKAENITLHVTTENKYLQVDTLQKYNLLTKRKKRANR